jgi:hypothetical protein
MWFQLVGDGGRGLLLVALAISRIRKSAPLQSVVRV